MPKVLRIINRFNLGGPTYNAAYLTKYLSPEFETMLIGGSPIEGEAHSGFILDQLGVTYHEIPEMSRSIHLKNDVQAFRKIRQIIREFKPDIVHTHAAKAGALGRIAARLEKVPVIVHTYHGHVFSNYFGSFKNKLIIGIEKWLAKKSTAIITISTKQYEEIVTNFKICSPDKAHVIRLGFDLSRFDQHQSEKRTAFRSTYHLPDDVVSIGIIGRIAPVKNHAFFFEALRHLKQSKQNWRAFVIGDGENKTKLMESVRDMVYDANSENNGCIVFTSWIKNIDYALAGLDIVVLTSVNEGTPVSLIEAQSAGKPVVTTAVGGVGDCVLENKSGYIIRHGSLEFSDALAKLIADKTLRDAFGTAGKIFVQEKFHYDRLVKEMGTLYRELLGPKNQF